MKETKYHEDGKIITVTGECPKNMKGVLFVVIEADGSEGLRGLDQLKKLEQVREPTQVREPEPAIPRVKRKRRPPKRCERLTEYAGHLAAGTDPVTAAVVSDVFEDSKPRVKIDWGKTYAPGEQVQLGEAMVLLAFSAFMLWWIVKFAI